ncbi:MAG: urease accessory protein UreD [Litoreibacter sp.]|nr:urease accessory protein UreD [Litoreibacter sp.]
MLDTPTPVMMQRVRGRAAVGMRAARGGTVLGNLHQSGSAKAMLPKVAGPVPEVVFLNTSGGITGGDRLDYAVTLASGASAVATTQTAERAYQSSGDTGHLCMDLEVGAGASLEWLPQETILFEGSNLSRRLRVELTGAETRFLFVEMLVLGRKAMGEDISDLRLRDRREIRRDGRLIFLETSDLARDSLAQRAHPALWGDARAVATLGFYAPGADELGDRAMAAVDAGGVRVAASGWDDKLIVRFAAPDLLPLKRAVAQALDALRGSALPRVWQI